MENYCVEVSGESLRISTTSGLFSPQHADRGTLAMLSAVQAEYGMKALDLGCGCGLVGIWLAKKCGAENVWMTDILEEAILASEKNVLQNNAEGVHLVQSDGFRSLQETGFDLILSNPPYQTDFSVAKHFIEKGFNRLKIGGTLYMVTKRLDWYKNKISGIFGGVRVQEIDGYYVFMAQKRSADYAKRKS